ncbi:MAG: DUF1501 domain-containing protein [Verrucomicrobia bacterium]|nr:DUF1501 domain-containing protein [Verrucomicrobiota bacterium]
MNNEFFCPEDRANHARKELIFTRRQFLEKTGTGFGLLGLAGLAGMDLLGDKANAAAGPLAPKAPHFPGKAKRVIHIFAQGAPSQVDTWDPKPMLAKRAGEQVPGMNGVAMASPFKFAKHGKSGIEVSEVFPELAKHVDEMAIIRSMHTNIPAHEIATVFMNTGSLRIAKPSLGSWVVYGLGSENQNIPGYISLRPGRNPPGGSQNWQSAFLPGTFQGTSVNTTFDRVEQMIQNIRSPYLPLEEQRRQLDLVAKFNDLHAQTLQKDPLLEARLEAHEMAFKMQTEATTAFDISKEPGSVRALYGNSAQGKQLLIARRLMEHGVRFIQVWAGGWDHHQDIKDRLETSAGEIDKPLAGLLTDLKNRGMLDSTLVVWGGEFGRKPVKDRNGNANPGRDHNNKAFSTWLAGGGIKGGTVYGGTDEFGGQAVENPVHIHDLHANILHALGFDHEKLRYRYNGRDFRLTDNFGKVIKPLFA